MVRIVVENRTNCVLNVALKHLGPIHYYNKLQPGAETEFNPGRVWFTFEGKLWNKDNEYTTADVITPIALTVTAAIGTIAAGGVIAAVAFPGSVIGTTLSTGIAAATGTAGCAAGGAATETAAVGGSIIAGGLVVPCLVKVGKAMETVGKIVYPLAMSNMVKQWTEKFVVREHRHYMNSNKKFVIVGGPNCSTEGEKQILDDSGIHFRLLIEK